MENHRARNGIEAVHLVQPLKPDLLLLDLEMPGKTGHEAPEVIKGDAAPDRSAEPPGSEGVQHSLHAIAHLRCEGSDVLPTRDPQLDPGVDDGHH